MYKFPWDIYYLRMRMGVSKIPGVHFSALNKPSVWKQDVYISLGILWSEDVKGGGSNSGRALFDVKWTLGMEGKIYGFPVQVYDLRMRNEWGWITPGRSLFNNLNQHIVWKTKRTNFHGTLWFEDANGGE